MKSISRLKIQRMLKQDGWYKVRQCGSHVHYKHNIKKGLVTVPVNKKSIHIIIVKSIENQSGISFC